MVPREYHHLLDVFEKGEKTTVPPHRPNIDLGIDLDEGKTVPIKKIYALSYDQLEELHRYIKQNEDHRWIRRVKSGRALPIMFVKKKKSKLRLCGDYRALNEVTKKDRHPLPLISEALDRVGELNTSPGWISGAPTAAFGLKKGTNGRQPFQQS